MLYPDPSISIGPFTLSHCIGRGGMGEVWAGRRRDQEMPVAIKMVREKRARDPHYLSLFRNEVRVAAGLDHPSIVTVLDQGVIAEADEERSGGRLLAGGPYLVMELVEGGSLEPWRDGVEWCDLERALLEILDALAHAHARGVIHRDLKPTNVLLRAGAPSLKLTDFGLAHALAHDAPGDGHGRTAGTPAYMAPEQFEGRTADYGPATDLYALGCLAFDLSSGAPPFGSRDPAALRSAHLYEAPPRLQPKMPVPAGFEHWVRRLLMKDPEQRFQCAADAAWALGQLELEGAGCQEARRAASPCGGTVRRGEPVDSTMVSMDASCPPISSRALSLLLAARGAPSERPPSESPPVPASWRRGERRPAPLSGGAAGYALHGLRTIPMVGREAERDRLWSALRDVHTTGRARAAVIPGPAGSGKSRLAEWLCERAHEVGAATIVRAIHCAVPGPGDGLLPMVARHLRLGGLPRAEALARTESALRGGAISPADARALAEMVAGRGDGQERLTTLGEQHVLLLRFLAMLGGRRPVIVWLDDVQWGRAALEFSMSLLRSQERFPCPIFLVLTAREEALATQPAEAELVGDLVRRPDAEEIGLGPLPRQCWPVLVQERLGLRGDLAVAVEERTAGNPLFAIQLVNDWVERGVLEPADGGGFRLRAGETAEIPDRLHWVWLDRVERLLRGRPDDDGRALEIAATLGHEIDGAEWREACAILGVSARESLVEDLISGRLARCGPEGPGAGWSFVHGMLQESLVRRASEAGRGTACHRACADMLRPRRSSGAAERLGRHLLMAGAPGEAIEPLTQGAEERLASGDLRGADAVRSKLEGALRQAHVPEDDRIWCGYWISQARSARARGQFESGEALAKRALAEAEKRGMTDLHIRALWELGQMASMQGSWSEGERLLREAAEKSRALADPLLYIDCLQALGCSLAWRSDPRAEAFYLRALEAAESAGDIRRAAFAALLLGLTATLAGDHAEALRRLEEMGAVSGHAALGPAAACQGARGVDRRAMFASLGGSGRAYADLFLGNAYIWLDRFAEAGDALQRSIEAFYLHGQHGESAAGLIGHATVDAALGRWEEFDAHLGLARHFLEETGIVMRQIATTAERAAGFAASAGHDERARAAREIARSQWERFADRGRAVS